MKLRLARGISMDSTVAMTGPAAAGVEADYIRRFDAAYEQRDKPEAIDQAERLIRGAVAEVPHSYELLWRAARHRYWVTDGTDDIKLRRRFARDGMDLSERGLRLRPRGIEANFFFAIMTALYAEAVGVLRAVAMGLEGKFHDCLETAIAADEKFGDGAPRLVKGRFYAEAPWPRGNLKKARAELERVLVVCPHALRAHLFMAETLVKDGKTRDAKLAVERALTGDIAYDVPEGKRVKERAALLARTLADRR